uniref:MmgE/PrpD family protein n=1 Tax=Sphingomonas sp. JE1 TaxID=1628059 RepID=A0A0D4ZZP4_9SPHN|nr:MULTISPECIES: MmgE/PrpD family protein [unclassified Sphingomonas]AJW29594.1 MmgE/PrpD family protein [Sphingomonas sp. JE1]
MSQPISINERLCDWRAEVRFADLPDDIVEQTKLRILDVIGLSLMARDTDVGASLLNGSRTLGGPEEASILGDALRVSAATAALANGAMAEVIEFDDTHNESIVHVGAATVSAALAMAEAEDANGEDLLLAVATGSEAVCRLGIIAPGAMHRRGYHPTGIFCPFGAALAAGGLMRMSRDAMVSALGIAGSQAAGLLECWVDGSWAKVMHPGWAAHSAIVALRLARAGFTGPARIFEGNSGLFASHVQDPAISLDYARAVTGLGHVWESRDISFKPYPSAHVIHGLIEAALMLAPDMQADQIERVACSVAPHWVPIVCEPVEEKRRPANSALARISLPHTIAEALVTGRLDATSYSPAMLANPLVRSIADRVEHVVRGDWTDRAAFPGEIGVTLKDGRIVTHGIAANLGGAARPLDRDAMLAKFRTNAGTVLPPDQVEAVIDLVGALPSGSARALAGACVIGEKKWN